MHQRNRHNSAPVYIYICDCALPRSMPHHPNSLLCNFFFVLFWIGVPEKGSKKSGGSVDILSPRNESRAKGGRAGAKSERSRSILSCLGLCERSFNAVDGDQTTTFATTRPHFDPHRADYSASSRDREREKKKKKCCLVYPLLFSILRLN